MEKEFLKIGEAARILGLSQRTVYRRIKEGELPASKVGGVYLISRDDLDAMLRKSRYGTGSLPPVDTRARRDVLKCGFCFRVIESDLAIGAVCEKAACDRVLCVNCMYRNITHCANHAPNREQQWQDALQAFQRGELPLLLKASSARLRELAFIEMIAGRLSQLNTLRHPRSGEIITLDRGQVEQRLSDDRAKVMDLLGTAILTEERLSRTPVNASLDYSLVGASGQAILFHARVVNGLDEFVQRGFVCQPLSLEDLLVYLTPLQQQAAESGNAIIAAFASTSGWDDSVLALVSSAEGQRYHSENVLLYLMDLHQNELIYDYGDEHLVAYSDLFAPKVASEELAEVEQAVADELIVHESLALDYAAGLMAYPRHKLKQAFESLAKKGGYVLVDVPNVGMAIVRE